MLSDVRARVEGGEGPAQPCIPGARPVIKLHGTVCPLPPPSWACHGHSWDERAGGGGVGRGVSGVARSNGLSQNKGRASLPLLPASLRPSTPCSATEGDSGDTTAERAADPGH